jgi:hypothetical protein
MFGSRCGCLHPLHNARVCKEDVDFAFFGCDLPVEPIKIFQVGRISLIAATFFPISLTALSNSAWRRPVIKTNAPSATKRLAAARPIPLLPPVITATYLVTFASFVSLPFLSAVQLAVRENRVLAW